jgi:hypothetical protein
MTGVRQTHAPAWRPVGIRPRTQQLGPRGPLFNQESLSQALRCVLQLSSSLTPGRLST